MAYGLLAGLPPVYGLYVSLFPVVVYSFLASSKHVSVGTFAVMSIVVNIPITRLVSNPPDFVTEVFAPVSDASNSSLASNDSTTQSGGSSGRVFAIDGVTWTEEEYRVAIATALTLLAGVFQCAGSLMRLGFLTSYLSEPMVTGFTTGASMYVCVSQIAHVVGYKVPTQIGTFKLLKVIPTFFRSLLIWIIILIKNNY